MLYHSNRMHDAVMSKLIATSRGSPCDSMASCFISVTVTVNGLVKLIAFNAHICPSKYLVYLFLKLKMVAADTTSSVNLFQWSTILWLKKRFLISSRELFLYSFKPCPLKSIVVAFWNNCSELIFSLPVRILYGTQFSAFIIHVVRLSHWVRNYELGHESREPHQFPHPEFSGHQQLVHNI